MKGRYQLPNHAPDAQEGDVGDGVQDVDGGDGVEVGVLLVIAFGTQFGGWQVGALVFYQGGTITGVGGRRGLSGTGWGR